MRARKPEDIPLEMPPRKWEHAKKPGHGMTRLSKDVSAGFGIVAKNPPIPVGDGTAPSSVATQGPRPSADSPGTPTPGTPTPEECRVLWDTVMSTASHSSVAEYLEHEKALQDYEGQKLNRLQIMTWAQQTRARFLRLSMADRKIFLDVLTADEGGAMARMFSLQAKLESEGVDDDQLKLTKAATKALKPGGHIDDAIAPVRKALNGQKQAKQREQKMLTAGSRAALPPGRALALPGGKE